MAACSYAAIGEGGGLLSAYVGSSLPRLWHSGFQKGEWRAHGD